MKSLAAILLVSFCCAGASCETREDPPTAVEVKVAVPVACEVPEPQCQAPAYDSAKKEQPGDDKIKLLRVETIEQADCLRLYRDALQVCRTTPPPVK